MRPTSPRLSQRSSEIRRRIEGLDGLPIRPATARASIDAVGDPAESSPSPSHPSTELDPGWIVARVGTASRPDPARSPDPLEIVEARPWWTGLSAASAEAVGRLWRHSVAVSLAARRLAREADDPDPGLVGRAGLLTRLALWGLAAVDPDRLAYWLATAEPDRRRELETLWFGGEADALGRTLAERWGCPTLVVDATWLHGGFAADLAGCAAEPDRLALIRRAHALAEQTPWSLDPGSRRDPAPDPRVRLLMAEVQARCGGAFVDSEPTSREERLTRDNAAIRLEAARLRVRLDAQAHLVAALAGSLPGDRPEVWAEKAGRAFCDLQGVAAARVVWNDEGSATEPLPDSQSESTRPAGVVVPLGDPGRPCATVHLWTDPSALGVAPDRGAWSAWAELVADHSRLRRRLDSAVAALRQRAETQDADRTAATLAALAEFAGGAGHELNNPLAVILGRAQLLLAREDDADAAKSLRAIVGQAQRAHRILRDLMFIARPPEPRPRPCSADEILRASVRDAQGEAEARGVRLMGDPRAVASAKIWADPDNLRHLADILVRNALEATPNGGTVSVTASGDEARLRWTVKDTGRGLSAHEAAHLFDPFFCGRQAGRGLGLGLPRARRIVDRAGGEISWQSSPDQGASFVVRLPTDPPPPSAVSNDRDTAPTPRVERARSA